MAACLLWTSAPSFGQVTTLPHTGQHKIQPQAQSALPYTEVLPFKEDKLTVKVFVSFDCPFSFQYDSAFWQWSRDLPRNWKVDFVPVVTGQPSSFAAIKTLKAVQIAEPTKLEMFMNRAFVAVQNEKRNPAEEETWRYVLEQSGINMERFARAWESLSDGEALIAPIQTRMNHYEIKVTPSVVIDGRYVITPENTNGHGDLFMQLLNGMISKAAGYA